MNKIYLYGIGGHANVIRDILSEQNVTIAGVFDDDPEKVARDPGVLAGLRLGGAESLAKLDAPMLIAIGSNRIRSDVANQLSTPFAIAKHPSAVVSGGAKIGQGSVVFHQSVIQTGTRIGQHAIINTGANVDHDCQVGDFAHVSPNATLCGEVSVGEGTQIGAGAVVIQGVTIGKWAVVGAGAVVIRDVPDFATVVGNPARVIKQGQLTETETESMIEKNPLPEQIEQKLRQVVNEIREYSGRSPFDQLEPQQTLQGDLGLDSLELAELTVKLEAEFGVDVFAKGVVRTVGEVARQLEGNF